MNINDIKPNKIAFFTVMCAGLPTYVLGKIPETSMGDIILHDAEFNELYNSMFESASTRIPMYNIIHPTDIISVEYLE